MLLNRVSYRSFRLAQLHCQEFQSAIGKQVFGTIKRVRGNLNPQLEIAGLLDGIDTAKGTIRFTPEKPLSDDIMRALVTARSAQIDGR